MHMYVAKLVTFIERTCGPQSKIRVQNYNINRTIVSHGPLYPCPTNQCYKNISYWLRLHNRVCIDWDALGGCGGCGKSMGNCIVHIIHNNISICVRTFKKWYGIIAGVIFRLFLWWLASLSGQQNRSWGINRAGNQIKICHRTNPWYWVNLQRQHDIYAPWIFCHLDLS